MKINYWGLLPGQRFCFRPGDCWCRYLGNGWHYDVHYKRNVYLHCDVLVIADTVPSHYSFQI